MKTRPIDEIREVLKLKNYKFFEKGDFNLNLIAVREDDIFDNKFSDTLYAICKVNGVFQKLELSWTTKAGVYGHGGEQDPLQAWETGTADNGVAVVVEGQYLGAFELVLNGGGYPFDEYFKQIKPLAYYRDNDKNGVITRGKVVWGEYSTHLHAMSVKKYAGTYLSAIGYKPWSMGCMGADYLNFQRLKNLALKAASLYSNKFSYTLLHEKDFV